MKTYLDCYPCFLRQALSASRRAGVGEARQLAVLRRVLDTLKSLPPGATPPEVAHQVHRMVRAESGVADPYRQAKEESTRQALAIYPRLKALVEQADDPLDTAIRLSIAGNIIDFGARESYDLWETVERVLHQPYALDDREKLREALSQADHLLYLGDNAGETVFDRLLIEVLPLPVIYAVKGGPVLNDATLEDALAAGLDEVATLIDTGADAAGTILSLCSDSFREAYEAAPLIIAKGQGNYETLSEAGPKVFCLLQVKCEVIARDLGVPVGSIVVKQSTRA